MRSNRCWGKCEMIFKAWHMKEVRDLSYYNQSMFFLIVLNSVSLQWSSMSSLGTPSLTPKERVEPAPRPLLLAWSNPLPPLQSLWILIAPSPLLHTLLLRRLHPVHAPYASKQTTRSTRTNVVSPRRGRIQDYYRNRYVTCTPLRTTPHDTGALFTP